MVNHDCDKYELFCEIHLSYYCVECFDGCPECQSEFYQHQCIDNSFCSVHNVYYCAVCGCGECNKKSSGKNDMKCSLCKSSKHMSMCAVHSHYWCMKCVGYNCEFCELDGSLNTECIVCGSAMSSCETHNEEYYCEHCGYDCEKCKIDSMINCEKCKLSKEKCQYHKGYYRCVTCGDQCDQCAKEESRSNRYAHHCGSKFVYCSDHDHYICPVCDVLTDCSIHCDSVRHCKEQSYVETIRDLEFSWEDFQLWQKERDRLKKCLDGIEEKWGDLLSNLSYIIAMNDFGDGVPNKMAILDNLVESLGKIKRSIYGDSDHYFEHRLNDNGEMIYLEKKKKKKNKKKKETIIKEETYNRVSFKELKGDKGLVVPRCKITLLYRIAERDKHVSSGHYDKYLNVID